MGLTITATFEKQGIYFAGDTLECHIRFSNERSNQKNIDSGHTLSDDRVPTMAVATRDGTRPNSPRSNGVRSVSRKFTDRIVFPTAQAEPAREAAFPNLDYGAEYLVIPRPSEGRRYSGVPGSRRSLSRPPPPPPLPKIQASSSRLVGRASERGGLTVFPSLEGGSPGSADLSPRAEISRAFRGSSGAYDGQHRMHENHSPAPMRRQPSTSNGRDAGAMSPDVGPLDARLSTSSALSTPTTAFTSWLPFGLKQQQGSNHPRKPTPSVLNESAPSETGSSGLLSNLWRNISGGSNPPSRPATRTGTMAEDDSGVERLAIGFAEASGSISLSLSYIRPEQMELLMAHRGTNYTAGRSASISPVGGGLGGWAPAAHASSGTNIRTQRSLPLLISSPTVLFSELAMAPGETQTFSLKIQLPKSLPPSFRGRTACISYDLVVIAKRSMLDPSSHVVRIPFRVLARVGHSGSSEVFAFDSPVHMMPSHSRLTFQESTSVATPRNTSPSLATDTGDLSQANLANAASKTAESGCGQLAKSDFLQSLLHSVDVDMAADVQSVPSIEFGAQSGQS
ncbi:Golgi membrane exchange factor (Ric1p-Rgp1p) subunit, partial [Coemansia sp. 'formosensis']